MNNNTSDTEDRERKSLVLNQISFWISIIGIVVTVISIFVGVLPFIHIKDFSYEEVSVLPIANINKNAENIKILWGDNEANDARIVLIKLLNSGDRDIVNEDFIQEIGIHFNEDAKILDAQFYDSKSKSLFNYINNKGLKPNIKGNYVVIPKIYFNSGDSIGIKLVVTNYKNYSIDGRIKGIKSIDQKIDNIIKNFLLNNIGIAILAILAILILMNTVAFSNIKKLRKMDEEIELTERQMAMNSMLLYQFHKELSVKKPDLMREIDLEYKKYTSCEDNIIDAYLDFVTEDLDVKDENVLNSFKSSLKQKLKDEIKRQKL